MPTGRRREDTRRSPTRRRQTYVTERLRLQERLERSAPPSASAIRPAFPILSGSDNDDDVVGTSTAAGQFSRQLATQPQPGAARGGMMTAVGERWSARLDQAATRVHAPVGTDAFEPADALSSDEEPPQKEAPRRRQRPAASGTEGDALEQAAGQVVLIGYAQQIKSLTADQQRLEAELLQRGEELARAQAQHVSSAQDHGVELERLRAQLQSERKSRQRAENAQQSEASGYQEQLAALRASLTEARATATQAEAAAQAGCRAAQERLATEVAARASAEQRLEAQARALVQEVEDARKEGEAAASRALQRLEQETSRQISELQQEEQARARRAEAAAREAEEGCRELEVEVESLKRVVERERREAVEREGGMAARLAEAEERIRQLEPLSGVADDLSRSHAQELEGFRMREAAHNAQSLEAQRELRSQVEALTAASAAASEEAAERLQREIRRVKDRTKAAAVKELRKREAVALEKVEERDKTIAEQAAALAGKQRELRELADKFAGARLQTAKLETEVACVRDSVAATKCNADEAERRAEQQQARCRDLEQQLDSVRKDAHHSVQEAERQRRVAEKERNEERARRLKAEEEAGQAQAEAVRYKGLHADARSDTEGRVQELRRKLQEAELRCEGEAKRSDASEKKAQAAERTSSELREEVGRLRVQVRAAEETKAQANEDLQRLQGQYKAITDRLACSLTAPLRSHAHTSPEPSPAAPTSPSSSAPSSSLGATEDPSPAPQQPLLSPQRGLPAGAEAAATEQIVSLVGRGVDAGYGKRMDEIQRLLGALSANDSEIETMRGVLADSTSPTNPPRVQPVPRVERNTPAPGRRASSVGRRRE